jgi:hypothetical protein
MPPRARRCVICDRLLGGAENPWFPFCSERCKLVDLGRWLGEAYRIPGPTVDGEDASAIRQEEEEDRGAGGHEG